MTDDQLVALYSAQNLAVGISPRTIRLRESYLRRVPNLAAATADELLLWMAGYGWAPSTRDGVRAILGGFYRWLRRRGYRPDDPAEDLPRVHVPPTVPRPVPDDVVNAALLAASQRDQLMIALGACAGLRRSEVAGLRWADYAGGVLHVKGKGGRERAVLVDPVLAGLLDAEHRRRLGGGRGTGWRYRIPAGCVWVFPEPSGRGHLSEQRVGTVLAGLLGGRWTAHSLRRRFATQAYAAAHDLLTTQQLLGHSSPNTTQRYVALDHDAAAAAVAHAARGLVFSPRR